MEVGEKEINCDNLNSEIRNTMLHLLSHFIFLYSTAEDWVWIFFFLCEFVGSNCHILCNKKKTVPLYTTEYAGMISQEKKWVSMEGLMPGWEELGVWGELVMGTTPLVTLPEFQLCGLLILQKLNIMGEPKNVHLNNQ